MSWSSFGVGVMAGFAWAFIALLVAWLIGEPTRRAREAAQTKFEAAAVSLAFDASQTYPRQVKDVEDAYLGLVEARDL